jgi:hypothetical protein
MHGLEGSRLRLPLDRPQTEDARNASCRPTKTESESFRERRVNLAVVYDDGLKALR